MHDGRRAEQNIQSQVKRAPGAAEEPVSHNLVGEGERDHKRGHEDVRERERHEEEVLWRAESAAGQHRHDDQNVTNNGDQNDDGNHEDDERGGRLAVRPWGDGNVGILLRCIGLSYTHSESIFLAARLVVPDFTR